MVGRRLLAPVGHRTHPRMVAPMVTITLSPAEARLLARFLSGLRVDNSGAVDADAAVGTVLAAAVLRNIAARIETQLGCPECGQLDAHAARCSLRNPDRD